MLKTGVDNRKLKKCPNAPNCVNSQATDKRHSIDPIHVNANPLEAKNYILKALGQLKVPNKVVVIENNYIRAEFVSKVFRFVDDVEFYFTFANSRALLFHVRSASRIGYFDFGVNRKRIEMIRSEIEKIKKE